MAGAGRGGRSLTGAPGPGVSHGVLLLSFGSARDEDDVPAYLDRVRRGRPVPAALVADLRARYRRIGGSPLADITRRQAMLLQLRLDPRGRGDVLVRPAMLHAAPEIPDAVADLLGAGARCLVTLPLAPQVSPHHAAYEAAVREAVAGRAPVHVAGSWHRHPVLLGAIARRTAPLLAARDDAEPAAVLFTAHSLPLGVPGVETYRSQVGETAADLARRLGLEPGAWRMVFQSRSGPAEDWLGPDIGDAIPELAATGCRRLVVVPVQFMTDHLEVLYDLDVAARAAAEAAGMRYLRPGSLNAAPELIQALADAVAAAPGDA